VGLVEQKVCDSARGNFLNFVVQRAGLIGPFILETGRQVMKRKNRSTESIFVSRRIFLLSSASAVVGVATYSRLGSIAHAAQGKFDKDFVHQTSKEINFDPFTWPSMPPADCPFEKSTATG
jgi:hypothetical protein